MTSGAAKKVATLFASARRLSLLVAAEREKENAMGPPARHRAPCAKAGYLIGIRMPVRVKRANLVSKVVVDPRARLVCGWLKNLQCVCNILAT